METARTPIVPAEDRSTTTQSRYRGVAQDWRNEHILCQRMLETCGNLRTWLTGRWVRRRTNGRLFELEAEFDVYMRSLLNQLAEHHGSQNVVTNACIEAMRQANVQYGKPLAPRYIHDNDEQGKTTWPTLTAHEFVPRMALQLSVLCSHRSTHANGDPKSMREQLNTMSCEVRSWYSLDGLQAELEIEISHCLEWLRSNYGESITATILPQGIVVESQTALPPTQKRSNSRTVDDGMDWKTAKSESETSVEDDTTPDEAFTILLGMDADDYRFVDGCRVKALSYKKLRVAIAEKNRKSCPLHSVRVAWAKLELEHGWPTKIQKNQRKKRKVQTSVLGPLADRPTRASTSSLTTFTEAEAIQEIRAESRLTDDVRDGLLQQLANDKMTPNEAVEVMKQTVKGQRAPKNVRAR